MNATPAMPASSVSEGPDHSRIADDRVGLGSLVAVWVVVLSFAAVTLTMSRHVGIAVKDPGGEFFRSRLLVSVGLLGLLAVADAAVRSWRAGHGARSTRAELTQRWTSDRLALVIGALLAYYLVYLCYHNLKSWDVLNSPRDDRLLSLDAWLFFGHSPAVLLHDLLGQHLATYVLVVVYESFGYLVTLSVVSALAFSTRIRDGYVFVTAAIWLWILGVACYYLVPSLGPFASAPQDFAGLPHTVITSHQSTYLAERAHLLSHPRASDAFAQISAFASLHVGFSCLILLMTRYFGLTRAARAMAVYLVATIVATIYLGWHYAVDDVAGLLIAVVAVTLGRRMIEGRPGSRPGATAPDDSSRLDGSAREAVA
jgi:hypothetical protein